MHRAIRDHLGAIDHAQITSVYDLALIIIDECSKVFFDRTKPDLRPEVVDMFSSAISSIVSSPTWQCVHKPATDMEGVQSEKKTDAYERFGRDVKRMNTQDPLQTAEELLRKSLNIKFEWSVLMEAQNLIDQLQIMQEIFTQQITVMGDFEKALRAMSSESQGPSDLKPALARAAALIEDMKLRRDELWNLEKRQANTRSQVTASYHVVIVDLGMLTAIPVAARTPRHEATAVGHYRGQGRHPQGRRERCARQIDCRLHRGDHFLRKLTCPPHCPPRYIIAL